MNDSNLKNQEATQFRSGEEAAENGKKGGIASGEARRARKTVQEALRALMDEKMPDSTGDTRLDDFIRKAYENELKKPDLYSLLNLQKLLGEMIEKMEINTGQAQSAKEALDVLLGRDNDETGA